MNSKSIPVLIALLTFTVAFAGCTTEDGAEQQDGPRDGDFDLGNKGAINGLVVDDNFRPVQLKQDWGAAGPGDFQDIGFILVVETGQRLETSENGEFQVLPLEPGRYTLKVAADNHEAIDRIVEVIAGEFTEITLEARRQFSGGGTTLSQEYVMFIACSADAAGYSAAGLFCGDVSGDSQRAAFDSTNYVAIADDVRGMVTEMRAHDDGYYGITVRTHELSCDGYNSLNGCIFSEASVDQGRYVKTVVYPDLVWQPDGTFLEEGQDNYCTVEGWDDGSTTDCNRHFAMDFNYEFETVLFPQPETRTLTDPLTGPIRFLYVPTYTPGVGVVLGVKAQFLQTAWLYELPEGGIDDYCALCDEADIPE